MTCDHLPTGTCLLNTTDGELGRIMNGFSFDPATGWSEYEVHTRFGVERWQRPDFILFSADENYDS